MLTIHLIVIKEIKENNDKIDLDKKCLLLLL